MLQHPLSLEASPSAALTPTACVVWQDDHWIVWTDWTGASLDRPRTSGISTGPDRHMAGRIAAAIDAGVAWKGARVARDVHGRTFVEAAFLIGGRRMHQDLRRLGY